MDRDLARLQGLGRFPEPWKVENLGDRFQVYDATGRFLMAVTHREDLHKGGWTQSDNHLTEEEAEVLAGWIARLPILMRRPPY
jgi:hypothetical protein